MNALALYAFVFCTVYAAFVRSQSNGCDPENFETLFGADNYVFLKSNVGHYIVAILPVRHCANGHFRSLSGESGIATINDHALWISEALIFAQKTQEKPHKLGLLILDNCSSRSKSVQILLHLESCTNETSKYRRTDFMGPGSILSYLAMSSDAQDYLTVATSAFEKSVIPITDSNINQWELADITSVIGQTVQLVDNLGLKGFSMLYSTRFQKAVSSSLADIRLLDICIYPIAVNTSDLYGSTRVVQLLKSRPDLNAILVLADANETRNLFQNFRRANLAAENWIWIAAELETYLNALGAPIFALQPAIAKFTRYLHTLDRMPWSNVWMFDYLSCNRTEQSHCRNAWAKGLSGDALKIFSRTTLNAVAVFHALSDGFNQAVPSGCLPSWTDTNCFDKSIWKRKLNELHISSQNYQYETTALLVAESGNITEAGNFINNTLILNNPLILKHLVAEQRKILENPTSTTPCSGSGCNQNCATTLHDHVADFLSSGEKTTSLVAMPIQHRPEAWAFILSILAGIALFTVIVYEIFILVKICQNLSNAPPILQSCVLLSQLLLFGVFVALLTAFAYAIVPTVYTCGATRFLTGFAYTLMFSALFIKSVVLLSVQRRQYLAPVYQTLLFVLIMAIQLLSIIQWLLYSPPEVIFSFSKSTNQLSTSCSPGLRVHVRYLAFPMLLSLVTCFIAFSQVQNPHNYREAAVIAVVSSGCNLLWIAWLVTGCVAFYPDLSEPTAGFGLLVMAIVIFTCMFVSEGRRQAVAASGIGFTAEDALKLWQCSAADQHTVMKTSNGKSATMTTTSHGNQSTDASSPTSHSNNSRISDKATCIAAAKRIPVVGIMRNSNPSNRSTAQKPTQRTTTVASEPTYLKASEMFSKRPEPTGSQITLDIKPASLAYRSGKQARRKSLFQPTLCSFSEQIDSSLGNTPFDHNVMLTPQLSSGNESSTSSQGDEAVRNLTRGPPPNSGQGRSRATKIVLDPSLLHDDTLPVAGEIIHKCNGRTRVIKGLGSLLDVLQGEMVKS